MSVEERRMRRSTSRSSSAVRAFVGTMFWFVVLMLGTFIVILLEHYLENFKSH
jgi:hypothetical protein